MTKENIKSISVDKACVGVVIFSLLVGVFLTWSKLAAINVGIIALDKKLMKHLPLSSTILPQSISAPLQEVQQLRKNKILNTDMHHKERPTMTELGKASGTDKIKEHGYDRFYPYFLEPLRDIQGLQMLEIGYNLGKSYEMWLKYFPKGMVYFMEKDPGQKHPEARFTGDQGSVEDLERLLATKGIKGQLDFIIDDGSHHPEHQMISFEYLFKYGLKPGGVYIIEDTETSYWRSGNTYGLSTEYGQNSPASAINRLKGLIDVCNRRYQPADEPFRSTFSKELDDSVQSIFFGPNSVVIIKMRKEEMGKFSAENYLWKDKLRKPLQLRSP